MKCCDGIYIAWDIMSSSCLSIVLVWSARAISHVIIIMLCAVRFSKPGLSITIVDFLDLASVKFIFIFLETVDTFNIVGRA